jgi:serine/threonine protein kinase
VGKASSTDDPLELYDRLVMSGQAPPIDEFVARYPEQPSLRDDIVALERLRGDLDRATRGWSQAAEEWPARIGGLRLTARLGEGGGGVVFAAEDESGQRVAVKVLRHVSAIVMHRLEREVRLAARLEHPGIARVIGSGIEGHRAYLVSELIEGRSLRDVLQQRSTPFVPQEAMRIALGVAEALAHAHANGVVHRDVKPSNIMLTPAGGAKLIDFGLAVEPDLAGDRITMTGIFVGSHNYAAPEQLRGEKHAVGPWSDTYALGATLFEMLTGQTPFQAATAAARAQQSEREPATGPHAYNAEVSGPLDGLVLRALAPKIRRRFADGGALATALRRCLR